MLRCFQQAQVLSLRQFLILGTIGLPLTAQVFYLAVGPAQEIQKAVDGSQHGIDGADRITLFLQRTLIGNGVFLGIGAI